MYAARTGRRKTVELLMKKGGDAGAKNAKGETALLFACSGASGSHNPGSDAPDFEGVVQLLLDSGASVADTNQNGLNAVHCAATTSPSLLLLFQRHFASSSSPHPILNAALSQKTILGETPLHLAALEGLHKSCLLLLSLGADPLITSKAGKRPSALTKDVACLSLLRNAESTASQAYYEKQDLLLQSLASEAPSAKQEVSKKAKKTSSTKKKKTESSGHTGRVPTQGIQSQSSSSSSSSLSSSYDDRESSLPKAQSPSLPLSTSGSDKVQSESTLSNQSESTPPPSIPSSSSPLVHHHHHHQNPEPRSWASIANATSSSSTSPQILSMKYERSEETSKTAEEVAAAADGLTLATEQNHTAEAMAKAQKMLAETKSEARSGAAPAGEQKHFSSPPSSSLDSSGYPPLFSSSSPSSLALENLEERVSTMHPLATALELKVSHLLGLRLSELSMEQLEALSEIHRNALACIEQEKLELVRKQERAFFEEELERRIDLLKRLFARDMEQNAHAAP